MTRSSKLKLRAMDTYVRQRLPAQSVIPAKRGKENLARAPSARRDAARLPATNLSAPRTDRERILLGQTQALGSGTWTQSANASASSPLARSELQSVSPEAATFSRAIEDVNRTRCPLVCIDFSRGAYCSGKLRTR
jgi:hypothetical protein